MKPRLNGADISSVDTLPLHELVAGETRRWWLRLTYDEIGDRHRVPVIARHGAAPGPVVAVTAVIHGNELNGMHAIHRLFDLKETASLRRGTLLAVPVVNVPGYRRHERAFADGKDLNRFMKRGGEGRPAQRFGLAFANELLRHCDYLVDLHTAGGGRRNTLYARVDLENKKAAKMARVINTPIIAHKPPRSSSLRGAAAERGIPAVVIEIGDPGRFQPKLVAGACRGMIALLAHHDMIASVPERAGEALICRHTYWLRASEGGALRLTPSLGQHVRAGECVGTIVDVWGATRQEVRVPTAGVVIGKIRRPMVMEGSPLLHIGIPND